MITFLERKYWTCVFTLLLFCISCKNHPYTLIVKHQDSIILNKNEAVIKDSIWTSYMKQIGEPDITVNHKETFRFDWERAFGPDILFRIQLFTDDSVRLISKIIFNCPPSAIVSMMFKGEKITIKKDTVVDSVIQRVSKKEWQQFYDILSGSYYWALGNICPNGYGEFDGDYVTLESLSWLCGSGQLQYHRVSIHDPKKGSFRSALEYLIRISSLTKNNKSYFLKRS